MSILTSMGTRRMYSLGSLIMYLYPVADGADGSTHATALNYVQGEWMNCTDDSTGLVFKGADVAESSGTLTLSIGEAGKTGNIHVITPELE